MSEISKTTEALARQLTSDISRERSEVANALYTILQSRASGFDLPVEFWVDVEHLCDRLRQS